MIPQEHSWVRQYEVSLRLSPRHQDAPRRVHRPQNEGHPIDPAKPFGCAAPRQVAGLMRLPTLERATQSG